MKKALTVSIVIPVYNEESYIEACLDAIAVQTVLPDEVIVVDNNSTDKTVRLVKKYPFVTLLHESEQGVLYARQTGMNAATSDIIGRIDGDTVLDTDWVHQVKEVFKDPAVNAVTGPNGYYDFIFPRAGLWLEDKLLKGALQLGYNFMFGCNMAIKRSVWQQVAPELCFDTSIFEDIDVAMHMQKYNMAPVYKPNLTVMVSARREASGLRDFCHYIHGHTRT